MRREDLFEERRRAHVRGEVAALVRGAEQRERVEGGGVDVVRVARVDGCHGRGVVEVALLLRALAVEDLDGVQVRLLARGGRLRRALGGGGRESRQGGEG